MRKNVFAAALILALGVGSFAACSSDDVVTPPQPGTETLGGTTFMTVKFSIPQGNAQRSNDYNFLGLWSGRDKIEGYKAYIFNGTAPTDKLEAVQVLTSTDFGTAVNSGTNELVVSPTKAIRVQPGTKTVFVVVNPNTTTDALLPSALATTTLQDFETAYKSKNLATAGAGLYTSSVLPANVKTSTENVAKIDNSGGTPQDVIVMTGASATVAVADGVSETAAATGPGNQAAVSVKRTVARVIVTSTDPTFTLLGDNPYTPGTIENNYTIGKVQNLHFVTAQSERELFFQQGTDAALTSATAYYNSPAINQQGTDDYNVPGHANSTAILAAYDYTNLWKNRDNTKEVLGGNVVHQATPAAGVGQPWTPAEIGAMAYDSDFILPTTHKHVAIAPAATYEYRKGNTAYVLVRAAFVPDQIQVGKDYSTEPAVAAAIAANNLTDYINAVQTHTHAVLKADASVQTPVAPVAWSTITSGNEPDFLVYGVGTHKFYTSEYASQDPVFQGVQGQPIQKFKKVVDPTTNAFLGYKMLYFAWVNPDNVLGANAGEWYNSPVYRNNIYHVEIDGIAGLGENYNPLVPATTVPNNGNTPHPNNPDPFIPNTPVTIPVPTPGTVPTPTPVTPPVTPVTPIKPQDPLTQKKTHMSVKVTVLPWQVHTYKFKLQN